MLEIPEAAVMADQLNQTITGKTIQKVVVAQNPHGFAWYFGDPQTYALALTGRSIGTSQSLGGLVEIQTEDKFLLFSDGINLRFHQKSEDQPLKHQFFMAFEDNSAISATVAMYGGISCFAPSEFDNPYYEVAAQKPSPLTEDFDNAYFSHLFLPELDKLSLKAFLATEQRIPGLGNGVLQDILFQARLHPKRKVGSLSQPEKETLFTSIKNTLKDMIVKGGRDTEKDLFGHAGGYPTRMSKHTLGKPCTECGSIIEKQAYMGGSIYFCPGCQTI
jgi:formamidopyrimidine-DNA glycosylase